MKTNEKIKEALKKVLRLILNPRFLLCFGLSWIVTNGWAYILFALGTFFRIGWMIAVSGAYLTFLWFPFTPEKVLTVALSILFLRLLFPKDEKTLGVLRELHDKAKQKKKKKIKKGRKVGEEAS